MRALLADVSVVRHVATAAAQPLPGGLGSDVGWGAAGLLSPRDDVPPPALPDEPGDTKATYGYTAYGSNDEAQFRCGVASLRWQAYSAAGICVLLGVAFLVDALSRNRSASKTQSTVEVEAPRVNDAPTARPFRAASERIYVRHLNMSMAS
jgi:hypothetical protein